MNRIWSFLLMAFLLSCSKDRTNRNPYLQEVRFQYEINLNLPLYSPLTNIGTVIYIGDRAVGTRGAFVMNTGSGFMAFEASCPNHAPNECSTMALNGQMARCSCEGYEYSLFTGQMLNRPNDGKRYHDMLYYQATSSGNIVIISN